MFTGALTKARKEELEDLAACPERGKKEDLLERIPAHFDKSETR